MRLIFVKMLPKVVREIILDYKYSLETHERHARLMRELNHKYYHILFRTFCRHLLPHPQTTYLLSETRRARWLYINDATTISVESSFAAGDE